MELLHEKQSSSRVMNLMNVVLGKNGRSDEPLLACVPRLVLWTFPLLGLSGVHFCCKLAVIAAPLQIHVLYQGAEVTWNRVVLGLVTGTQKFCWAQQCAILLIFKGRRNWGRNTLTHDRKCIDGGKKYSSLLLIKILYILFTKLKWSLRDFLQHGFEH